MSRNATALDVTDTWRSAPAIYSQAFHRLVEASYLKPSTVLSHQSPRDKRIQYETEEKVKISGFPTAKELRQAKEVAEARLRREEEEAEKIGMVSCQCLVVCMITHTALRKEGPRINQVTDRTKYVFNISLFVFD